MDVHVLFDVLTRLETEVNISRWKGQISKHLVPLKSTSARLGQPLPDKISDAHNRFPSKAWPSEHRRVYYALGADRFLGARAYNIQVDMGAISQVNERSNTINTYLKEFEQFVKHIRDARNGLKNALPNLSVPKRQPRLVFVFQGKSQIVTLEDLEDQLRNIRKGLRLAHMVAGEPPREPVFEGAYQGSWEVLCASAVGAITTLVTVLGLILKIKEQALKQELLYRQIAHQRTETTLKLIEALRDEDNEKHQEARDRLIDDLLERHQADQRGEAQSAALRLFEWVTAQVEAGVEIMVDVQPQGELAEGEDSSLPEGTQDLPRAYEKQRQLKGNLKLLTDGSEGEGAGQEQAQVEEIKKQDES